MITSIFNKSKPINLIIVSSIVVFWFIIKGFVSNFEFNLKSISVLFVALSSIIIIDFISKKNQLSNRNSFIILFFTICSSFYWVSATNHHILFSNFFILLALRKLISLKSFKNSNQKIFDATLWIAIASLFYFWSVLFLILVYISIFIYASENYKHFLIPFVSIFIVFSIINCFNLFFYQSTYQFISTPINIDFSTLFTFQNTVILACLSFLIIGVVIFLKSSIQLFTKKNKKSYVLIGIALVISTALFIFNSKIEVSLFALFPITVLFSVVFEQFKKRWLQESILITIILSAISVWFL